MENLLRLAPSLTTALLHSLWQAALLAAVGRVALFLVPFRRPNWRYGISVACLALVGLLFLVTWRVEMQPPHPAVATDAASSALVLASPAEVLYSSSSPSVTGVTQANATPSSGSSWQTILGLAWLAGVLVMVFRAARILGGESRLTRTAARSDDPRLLALLDEVRNRLGVARRVVVATVQTMASPAVVGIVFPVILIPSAIVTGSSPEALRAILAHELAHIRRWDVLVNLFQLLVESLFFFNPCVWLLSAQVRKEREACCDALAADCCGGAPAYARVLVDVGQLVLTGGAALPFASPHGLSDRVRRLLGLRPTRETWRLPPLSVVLALLAGFAGLLAVAQGTFKATDAVLSAKERIDLIEQTVEQQKAAEVGTTRYIGTVATPDGGLPPEGTALIVYSAEPHSSTQAACSIDRKSGRFQMSVTGTTAMLWLWAPGYTPWFEGPMRPGPEPVTDTGLWVLEPQTPLVIRILDEKGEPIPDAKVTERCDPLPNTSFPAGSATTDVNGECIVPLVADYPVSMEVEAPRFEPAKFKDLYPDEHEPLVLKLRPSLPLVLRVTDRESSKPITDATVRELAHHAPTGGSMVRQYDEAPVLGSSRADGVCSVSGLHRKGTYWLLVEAKGHGAELVASAVPGEKLDVQLGPPRVLTGKITGDLSKLQSSRDKPQAWVWHSLQIGGSGHQNTYIVVPIQIEDGIGTFHVETLYKGSFRVDAGGVSERVKVDDGETDVEFVVPPDGETVVPAREVRLEFERKEGVPLPRGTMTVRHRDLDNRYYAPRNLPVTNGVVSLRVPIGSSMEYEAGGVIGGWFARDRIEAVPAGETPLGVQIPYVPAGAISVSVVDQDGKPADGFLASVQEIEKSPLRTGSFLQVEAKNSSSPNDGISAFTVTPLPLGGTYEIVVHRGFTYVTTGPIQLNAGHPLDKRKLILDGGVTLSGQVVGPDGEPVADAPLSLNLELSLPSSSFSTSDIKTDDEGRFEFLGVVPHRQAKYTVRVVPERDYVQRHVVVKDLGQPVRIVLDRGLVVTGRILNAVDGSPVSEDRLRLWHQVDGIPVGPPEFRAEGPTGRDGSFRFSNLAPGSYKLYSDKARHDAESPTVTAGQPEPVIWRVPLER